MQYTYPTILFTALAPFRSDIDNETCGDIYYRESIYLNTLSLLTTDIRNKFGINFRATWALIGTYDEVCNWHFNESLTNSIQIVITASGYTSIYITRFLFMINYHGTRMVLV
jgi:hypothetical protein